MKTKILFCFFILIISDFTDSTLSQSDKKAKKDKTKDAKRGLTSKSVYMKNLVSKVVSKDDILQHYLSYHEDLNFNNFDSPVLGYVTPWNSQGYDIAKRYGHPKLNLISPVWLQIRPVNEGYTIEGLHDKDLKWMSKVKKADAKILPRVLFDKWSGQDYMSLFTSPAKLSKLRQTLKDLCVQHDFDGVVLEVWSQLGGQAKNELRTVINEIGNGFRQIGKLTVLVIPPPIYHNDVKGMFNEEDLDRLSDYVDYFSLMTYDYSSPQRPGPNSPIQWIRKCVEILDPNKFNRAQILLGLNFYGYDYTSEGGSPMVGHEFIKVLKEASSVKFKWDSEAQEHFVEAKYGGRKHTIFFPSLNSISNRILLAKELGTGLSIWELGQGLDYFYDLL